MTTTTPWLASALDYVADWLGFQMRTTERPGIGVAICQRDKVVLDLALGVAYQVKETRLTRTHQFRIASHSKTFTAAGVLKLRDRGLLQLDDPVGRFFDGLHPRLAKVRLSHLLSHSGGVSPDGPDAGYFQLRRPYLAPEELLAQVRSTPPVIDPNTRFKYSNHGFALLGLVIEAVTGESYASWMQREVIDAAGLRNTLPDMLPGRRTRLAIGHSGRTLLGDRVRVPGDAPTNAIAPAGGFVSTAADVARFYAQLMPGATQSILSQESRLEMQRRHRQVPHSSAPSAYGLGLMLGSFQGWEWFGHTGSLPGFVSRTVALSQQELTVTMLANSMDAFTWPWVDGVLQILQTFATHGAPNARTREWQGRWWSLWGAIDLVPTRDKVFAITPVLLAPFTDATELSITGHDRARMTQANGYASFGEDARLVRDARGRVKEVWLGGSCQRPEAKVAREMRAHAASD